MKMFSKTHTKIVTGLSLAGFTALAVASCGDFFSQQRSASRSGNPVVPDLTGNQLALAAIQGISPEQSIGVTNRCIDIVLQGPMDKTFYSESGYNQAAYHSFYCSLSHEELTKTFYEQVQTAKTGELTAGGALDAWFPMEGIPLPVKGNFNFGKKDAKSYSREHASQDASLYHKTLCTETTAGTSAKRDILSFQEVVSPQIAQAYAACVSSEQKGFSCNAKETPEGVSLELAWNPSETARYYLPKVELSFKTAENLELRSSELPKMLGVGTGESVTFSRVNPEKSSTVQVVAHDRGKAVTFACTNIIEPVAKPVQLVWAQHTVCGEKLKKTRVLTKTSKVDDSTKPRYAGHVEFISYKIDCGNTHNNPEGRCQEKGWTYKDRREKYINCIRYQGIHSRPSREIEVTVTCERNEVIGYDPKDVTEYVTENREVIPACLIDQSIPGASAITEGEAKKINDLSNYDAG